MKFIISIFSLVINISVFGSESDSSVSFINATKADDLIILGKIISYTEFDSNKVGCPTKMIVEVIEILKGNNSYKLITVEGYKKAKGSNLKCLSYFQIGKYYVVGLQQFEIVARGQHSLEYLNGIVKGNINNEPTKEYYKEYSRIFEILQQEKLRENRNDKKISMLRKELDNHLSMLDQTMDYKTFKGTLFPTTKH